MTESAGAAVHIDPVGGKAKIADGGHRDDGEGLVDLEQIDIAESPAGGSHQFADGTNGRGREQRRLLCMRRLADDDGPGRQASLLGIRSAGQYNGGSTV